ncbi:MAG: bifunctional pyr operon transcriptional regulator/uracil phosphoribosyltransferase, partial [Pseudomonadales bacterium]|nr:bifunctional pyr operon transcriptional regulator/uracil phosphoribosyltransferase [Pseudomonadales bacterium]
MHQLPSVHPLVDKMTEDLKQLLASQSVPDPVMVGIHTGGAWIAEKLHQRLSLSEPLGELDIAFYRDDYDQRGLQPQVKPSSLPFSTDGRHVILVD